MTINEYDIAIVGMSCRFPGAGTIDQFWQNLSNGVESIARLTDDEILSAGVPAEYLEDPHYVKASPVIDGPELFDASFFGFAPMEAKMMDPQHRILLELACEALEDAGCDPERYSGRIGVFTGSALNTYFMNRAVSSKFAEEYIPTLIGNDKDFISTRISYKLNLKGLSLNIQTACSTSLVAVHLACQSLLSGESDAALAGAISVRVPHRAGYFYDGGGIVSPDGHVRAFDAGASGTVFGSGGGVIVLKRLSDAIDDGDTILAVVKGSAVNNDGSEKAGFTAPSVNSQAEAVIEALANAGVDGEEISYIEAHGSGTPVGDPIEVLALTKAFRNFTEKSGFCAIGSVKTNVGHLDAAAGMAAIIKTVLSLKHRKIPASLHYSDPNPEIDFPSTPFYVNTQLADWLSKDPRRAGVLATGMGGTNAFLVMEEAPHVEVADSSSAAKLLTLSAKTESALDAATHRLREYLNQDDDSANMDDVAYTLQTGRKAYTHRRFLVCSDRADAVEILGQENSKKIATAVSIESVRRPVVFMFPGIGDHYVGMAFDLYKHFELFRREVDRCAKILTSYLDIDIHEIIYPEGGNWKRKTENKGIDLKKMLGKQPNDPVDPSTEKLNRTIYAHPAQFTIEYALAQFWMHLGVKPDAIVGHSMGEYVAACIAGVFSLEDALRLVATRAKLANALPQGGMLAVMLTEDELLPLLTGEMSLSLINGPNLCVVAGPVSEVAAFEDLLNEKGVIYRPVQNAHAFHSKMMDPIVNDFEAEVRQVHLREPKIPFISNVAGTWISREEATSPVYWAKHSNHTARFSNALHTMWQHKDAVILEIGPGRTLGMLSMQHPQRQNAGNPSTIASLRDHYDNQNDVNFLLQSVGRLWLAGMEIEWEKLDQRKSKRRVSLPSYPFERERFFIETDRFPKEPHETSISILKNSNISEWFYVPSWKRVLSRPVRAHDLANTTEQKKTWLFFSDDCGVCQKIIEKLKRAGQEVINVISGDTYEIVDSNTFIINAGMPDDYVSLVKSIQKNSSILDNIVHGWSISGHNSEQRGSELFRRIQELGFYSVMYLARSLAKQNINHDINFFVLSNNIQDILGQETLVPEKSTILGPCMVIPQEYPNLRTKSIDLELKNDNDMVELDIDYIFGEFFTPNSELFVAYRANRRWVLNYEQVQLIKPNSGGTIFRKGGVYLITGGLGEIGYEMSKYLAKSYNAKLVLVSRTQLPDKDERKAWLQNHDSSNEISKKIKKIERLEELGATVLHINSNVADLKSMKEVVNCTYQRFGHLNGVIHGAGIVGEKGFSEIIEIDSATCDLHFQAKAQGLYVLAKILEGKDHGFCMLLSSLTPILGGVGEVAYSSSNIFMDAFVRKRWQANDTKWISVNWDLWRIQDNDKNITRLGKSLEKLGIKPNEGMDVMETVLSVEGLSQVIVSTGQLKARIKQWIKLESLRDNLKNLQPEDTLYKFSDRPKLKSEYTSPRDDAEKLTAEIWQNVLGIENIGINDNFSELGGHSLLAIKIISELRKVFQINLPVRALFDTPTVGQLSGNIKEKILSEIENMSDEEAKRLISTNG